MPLSRMYRAEVVDANRAAYQVDPDAPGVRLGYFAIHAGIPLRLVAETLESYEMTVYRWFKGGYPRGTLINRKVRILTEILEHALAERILPIQRHNYEALREALDTAAKSLKSRKEAQREEARLKQ